MDGLDIGQIRTALKVGESQEHLTRRVRSLRRFYEVPATPEGRRYVYRIRGFRTTPVGDSGRISGKLRAAVLHDAKGRCQMCGKTIVGDGIRLQIDHKIPQNWGGMTVFTNLWAVCQSCNNGKRDYFSSFDEDEMEEILALDSVHERIACLLKLHIGQPVSSQLLGFVANATEQQEDWQKRLRDLRYPVIGLEILMGRGKNASGQTETTYTLTFWKDIPPDHKQLIRAWENRNRKKPSGD